MFLRIAQLPTVLQNVVEDGMFLMIWSSRFDDSLPNDSEITIGSWRV